MGQDEYDVHARDRPKLLPVRMEYTQTLRNGLSGTVLFGKRGGHCKANIEDCLTEERRPVAARPTVGDVIPVNAVTGDHRRRLAVHIDGRLSASRQQSSQPKPTVAALTTCSPNGTSPPRRRSRSRRFWRHSILQHDRARDKRLARVSHGLGLLHQGHMVSLNCSQQRWTVRVDSSHSPSRPLRPLTCVG